MRSKGQGNESRVFVEDSHVMPLTARLCSHFQYDVLRWLGPALLSPTAAAAVSAFAELTAGLPVAEADVAVADAPATPPVPVPVPVPDDTPVPDDAWPREDVPPLRDNVLEPKAEGAAAPLITVASATGTRSSPASPSESVPASSCSVAQNDALDEALASAGNDDEKEENDDDDAYEVWQFAQRYEF